jgi:2'-5' RNA ligase
MRLFTAIDLPAEMLEKLSDFLARLRPLAKLQWSAVEKLHITTKFIGEWPEGRIDEMKHGLSGVKAAGSIDIFIRGVEFFPDAKWPRVFYCGVEAGEPLSQLARATEQAISTLGVPVETRNYSPHLTLARIREAARVGEVAAEAGDPDFGGFQASSFFLYESLNGKYSKLAEFPFHS